MSETLGKVEQFLEEKSKSDVKKVIKRYNIINIPFGLIFGILWGMGVIVAKGFLATLAAFFIPFIGPAISVMWLLEKFAGVS
jgi:hypothetical protein